MTRIVGIVLLVVGAILLYFLMKLLSLWLLKCLKWRQMSQLTTPFGI